MKISFQLILILIAILIVLAFWFLIIRYFLFPLFFNPKLHPNETFEFLEKENLVFVDIRELTKKEKILNPFNHKKGISIKNMYSARTENIIVGFSISKKEHRFFWLEITQWYAYNMRSSIETLTGQKLGKGRVLIFKEILEKTLLTELKEIYEPKTILVTDKCPACQMTVSKKVTECPNCGLNFIA